MVDKFESYIEKGKVYSVQDGKVIRANPSYNRTNHP